VESLASLEALSPTPPTIPSEMVAHASIAPSDAPTLKMGNVSPSRGRSARIKARWNRLVSRREAQRLDNEAVDTAIQAYKALDRPPPEPPLHKLF
jgi:hypothetical protein